MVVKVYYQELNGKINTIIFEDDLPEFVKFCTKMEDTDDTKVLFVMIDMACVYSSIMSDKPLLWEDLKTYFE